jgi:hypothetical protein
MKLDLFNNKYKRGNVVKIIFADIVCFLLVSVFSISFCYAYFSDRVSSTGFTGMASVSIEYQYQVSGSYKPVDSVYGKFNNESTVRDLGTQFTITPGDTLTIVGRAVNTSGVPVFVLGKVEVSYKVAENAQPITLTSWYNIGTNDPQLVNGTMQSETPGAEESKLLKTNEDGMYIIGAGSLGAGKYKDLSVVYTFDGELYQNGYIIQSVTLTLHAYQKQYLNSADDFDNYSSATTDGVTYSHESIYATHQIVGNLLNNN